MYLTGAGSQLVTAHNDATIRVLVVSASSSCAVGLTFSASSGVGHHSSRWVPHRHISRTQGRGTFSSLCSRVGRGADESVAQAVSVDWNCVDKSLFVSGSWDNTAKVRSRACRRWFALLMGDTMQCVVGVSHWTSCLPTNIGVPWPKRLRRQVEPALSHGAVHCCWRSYAACV